MSYINNLFSDGGYDIKVSRIDLWFIFTIILVSPETVMFGTNANTNYSLIRQLFCLLLIPIIFVKHKYSYDKGTSNASITQGLILASLLFFSSIVNLEFGPQSIMRMLIILAGFYYVKFTSLKTFVIAFENIVFLIALVSLILYITKIIAPPILNFSLPMENVNGIKFHNFIIACMYDNSFERITRLQGPFREPGVAIVYFIYAFAFYLINTKKVNYKRIAVYVAVILLSYSTTGYFALAALLIFYSLNTRSSNQGKKEKMLIYLIVLAALPLYLFTDIFASDGAALGKLSEEDNISTLSRMASFFTSLEIISKKPLFGVGIEEADYLFKSLNVSKYVVEIVDNTNLYMSYAATYGILYALLCTAGILLFAYNLTKPIITKCLLCLPFMMVFIGETMFENVFLFILIAYGFNYKKNIVS